MTQTAADQHERAENLGERLISSGQAPWSPEEGWLGAEVGVAGRLVAVSRLGELAGDRGGPRRAR
jgi:hypothetical protein